MIYFKINSKNLSQNPSKIKTSTQKIQKSERTIDGTMVIDLVAIKNSVQVSWDILSSDDLKKLLNEIKSGFVTINYVDASVDEDTKTIVAQPGDISYSPFYDYGSSSIVWKDVSITFTEK